MNFMLSLKSYSLWLTLYNAHIRIETIVYFRITATYAIFILIVPLVIYRKHSIQGWTFLEKDFANSVVSQY